MSDEIIVENYCVVCDRECINTDPENYDHMYADWERFCRSWDDKGISIASQWAFAVSIVLSTAREAGREWDEVAKALKEAWDQGVAAEEEA